MSTNERLEFYKGEDKNALKQRFLELRLKYTNAYSNEEIASFVFDGLRDARKRAAIAAVKWGEKDKDVLSAIREAKQEREREIYFEDGALQKKFDELEDLKNNCEKQYLIYRIVMEQTRMLEEENKRKAEAAKNNPSTDICGLPVFEIVERAS